MLASAAESRDLNTACAASKRSARLLRHQCQRSKRGIEHAAYPVVQPDVFDIGWRRGHRFTGGGVGQFVRRILDENLFGFRRVQQRADPLALQAAGPCADRRSPRVRRWLRRYRRRIGREADECIFIWSGIGNCAAGEQKADGKYERHDAIVEATHCIPPRQSCANEGGGGMTAASHIDQFRTPGHRTFW